MRREILTGAHLNNLPVVQVVYAPRNMGTVAVQVTPDTIGAMAIEFGAEVTNNDRYLYMHVRLERVNDEGEKFADTKTIRLGDWLVELGNEVHIFPPDIMWKTFSQLKDPAHERALVEGVMTKEEFAAKYHNGPGATSFMTLPENLQAPEKLPDLPA